MASSIVFYGWSFSKFIIFNDILVLMCETPSGFIIGRILLLVRPTIVDNNSPFSNKSNKWSLMSENKDCDKSDIAAPQWQTHLYWVLMRPLNLLGVILTRTPKSVICSKVQQFGFKQLQWWKGSGSDWYLNFKRQNLSFQTQVWDLWHKWIWNQTLAKQIKLNNIEQKFSFTIVYYRDILFKTVGYYKRL